MDRYFVYRNDYTRATNKLTDIIYHLACDCYLSTVMTYDEIMDACALLKSRALEEHRKLPKTRMIDINTIKTLGRDDILYWNIGSNTLLLLKVRPKSTI